MCGERGNAADKRDLQADEDAAFARSTPSQRLELSVEISDVTRSLAESVESAWVSEASMALESKAHLYVAPLRALLRRGGSGHDVPSAILVKSPSKRVSA